MTVVRERDKGGGERHFNTVPRLGFPIECRLGIGGGGGDQQAGFEAGALIPLRHIGDLHQRADRKTARLVGGGRREAGDPGDVGQTAARLSGSCNQTPAFGLHGSGNWDWERWRRGMSFLTASSR